MAGETAGLARQVVKEQITSVVVIGEGANNVDIRRTLAAATTVDYNEMRFAPPRVVRSGTLEVADRAPLEHGLPEDHPEESATPRGQEEFRGGDVNIKLGQGIRRLGTLTIDAPEGTAIIGNTGEDLQRMRPLEVRTLSATSEHLDLRGNIEAEFMTLNGEVANVGPRVTADTVMYNGVQIHPPEGEGPSRVDVATLFPRPTAE